MSIPVVSDSLEIPAPVRFEHALLASLVLMSFGASACGPQRSYRAAPVPGWDQVSRTAPRVPTGLSASEARRFEQGWRALVVDDLKGAARNLEPLGRKHRNLAEVDAALGYLELRLGNFAAAERHFGVALARTPGLVSARAGAAQVALATGQDEKGFERLTALSDVAPEHALVASYLPPLRLRLAEARIQEARRLRAAKSYREAAEKYRQALEIAPQVSGFHSEVAEVELAGGEVERAAEHAAQAVAAEPGNGSLHVLYGDTLRAQGDLGPAVEAYGRARALLPEDRSVAEKLEEARVELERQSLPAEYFRIEESERIAREQLAALLHVKLRPGLPRSSRRTNVIATDISGSWARDFIRDTVAAGFLSVYPNHTFQPQAFVRRSELATALAATLSAIAPTLAGEGSSPAVADVAPDNLNYPAVALAVSLGLLPADASGRFDPSRFVSGSEAIEAVDALSRRVLH